MTWTGKINGITDPAKINGIAVANIKSVNSVLTSAVVDEEVSMWSYGESVFEINSWSYGESILRE